MLLERSGSTSESLRAGRGFPGPDLIGGRVDAVDRLISGLVAALSFEVPVYGFFREVLLVAFDLLLPGRRFVATLFSPY